MGIRVIYADKSVGVVSHSQLERLLKKGVIAAFHRGDGWVDTQSSPLRGCGGDYSGPERRNQKRDFISSQPLEQEVRTSHLRAQRDMKVD